MSPRLSKATVVALLVALALVSVGGQQSYIPPAGGTAPLTLSRPGIAVTSTDGVTLENATAATAGVPVQQSPRLRFRSNVWNTTATAATNTNDWFIESVPVSGTTPSGLLKFGHSLNGGAATFPLTLSSGTAASGATLASTLPFAFGLQAATTQVVTLGNADGVYASIGSASMLLQNRVYLQTPASGQLNISNQTIAAGIGLDVATDGVAKFRTRAQTGDAQVTGLGFYAGGVTNNAPYLENSGNIGWYARTILRGAVDGVLNISNSGQTTGSQIKVDALPTAGTCGTSPAVTAGSTPFAGRIDVGTATPASCIVVFGGTAFPSAPFCTANVVTSTAGDTRAIGTLSTTTQLTLTPASAFANNAIVAWHCVSSR